MRLMIGGAHQGKLAYALAATNISAERVAQGGTCSLADTQNIPLLNGFHALVRRMLEQQMDPYRYLEALLRNNPEIIIITDEIGCGVVPTDAFEREWREVTGRLCCTLAQRAHKVERVFCGIAAVIKEERA